MMKIPYDSRKTASLCLLAWFLWVSGCGTANEAGTSVGNPPATTKTVAAAVAAVFSGADDDEGVAAALFLGNAGRMIRNAQEGDGTGSGPCAENDPACTCSDGPDEGPAEVDTFLYGSAGTFGSTDYSLTVAEDDYCRLEDGTVSSGSGPDGDGLVAAFTVIEDIPVVCDGETAEIAMGEGSSGIFRNTTAEQTGTAYMPQIYGSFVFTADGESLSIDCTIYMDENASILFSDCADESGTAIELDAESSCSVIASE